jgi:hypothetical protein
MTNSGLLLNHPEMAAWFESAGNQAAFFFSYATRNRSPASEQSSFGGPMTAARSSYK